VTITDLCSIKIYASGSISINPSICSGNSLTLSTTAVSNYTWSNNSSDSVIHVSQTGAYSVTVSNDVCALNSAPKTVTQKQNPASPSAILVSDTLCSGISNMPVSVLEACACGLPVVATNVGGLPFLISDGENGLLVENENVNAMVQAVKMLLTDSVAAQKISRNAGLLAEKSSWTTLRSDWEELFTVVLKQASKKLPPRFSAKNLSSEK
jgi:hypothetical protein